MQDIKQTLGTEAAQQLQRQLKTEAQVEKMENDLFTAHNRPHPSGKNRAQRRAKVREAAR